MKERKAPKKPMIYYYVIAAVVLLLLNSLVFPLFLQPRVT